MDTYRVQGEKNQHLSGINCARSFKYIISFDDYNPCQGVINIFTLTGELTRVQKSYSDYKAMKEIKP